MNHYGFFTTSTLLVLTYVLEFVKANSTTKKDDLAFWSSTTVRNYVELSDPKQAYKSLQKLKLVDSRPKLENILNDLRRNGKNINLPDLEYTERSNGGEKPNYKGIGPYRRSRPDHVHGVNHTVKPRKKRPVGFYTNDTSSRKTAEDIKLMLRNKKDCNKTVSKHKLTKPDKKNSTENNLTWTKRKKKHATDEDSDERIKLFPYTILRQLQEDIIPQITNADITLEVIGRTVEYNDIVLMKASQSKIGLRAGFRTEKSKYSDDVPEKKIIFIVHGLSVLGFNQLPCLSSLENFLKLLTFYYEHLDKFDIYLIPMANPDGVAMGRSKWLWNKNMSPQKACPGVAVDRNFDVSWNESHDVSTCSQHFPGIMPFSEIESVAVRETLHKYSHRIMAYFHVHAGTYNRESFKGDAVLYPKGYTEVQTDDDKYIDLRGEIEETLKNASFKVISVNVDTLFSWYGKITGSSVDYASTVYGVPYAMELVMQLYEDDRMVSDSEERETNSALTEIWQRVLVTIFDNIYRSYKKSFDDFE